MIDTNLCDSYGVLKVILLLKDVVTIVQIAVPVLLIIMAMVDVIRLVVSKDPGDKKVPKKIIDRFLSAIAIFLITSIVMTVLNLVGVSKVGVMECWNKANPDAVEAAKKSENLANKKDEEDNTNTDHEGELALDIRTKINWSQSDSSTSLDNLGVPTNPTATGSGECSPYSGPAKNPGQSVVDQAVRYVGNPYVWGGTSLENGADCSGFTMKIYEKFGVSIPRTSDEQAAFAGKYIGQDISKAKAGDLIVYSGHVGIYMANGGLVHASNEREGIKISPTAAYRPILAIRRLFC